MSVLPQEGKMSASRYSTFHLTPNGWVEGSDKLDSGSTERPIPDNRVMTVTFHEHLSSSHSELGHVDWRHNDEERLKELIKKFGKVPYRYRDVPIAG
jgi:hypothetical protein